jgi:hypothetical protein
MELSEMFSRVVLEPAQEERITQDIFRQLEEKALEINIPFSDLAKMEDSHLAKIRKSAWLKFRCLIEFRGILSCVADGTTTVGKVLWSSNSPCPEYLALIPEADQTIPFIGNDSQRLSFLLKIKEILPRGLDVDSDGTIFKVPLPSNTERTIAHFGGKDGPSVRVYTRNERTMIIHRHDHSGSGGTRSVNVAPGLAGTILATVAAECLYLWMANKPNTPLVDAFEGKWDPLMKIPGCRELWWQIDNHIACSECRR